MFTRTSLAPSMEMLSRSSLEMACLAASSALSGPTATPVPIIAPPPLAITLLTSSKSRLISPGEEMMLLMPSTALERTPLAMPMASSKLVSSPTTLSSLSLGITIKVSSSLLSLRMPSSALFALMAPS